MTTTDWRALCADLADALDAEIGYTRRTDGMWITSEDVTRARAALAAEADGPAVSEGREPASVKAEPSDKELLELMPQQLRKDLATVSRMAAYGAGTGVTPGLFRVSLNTGALDFARAVLARFGHQPAPPAAGEVGELVDRLRRASDGASAMGWEQDSWVIARAADLLEQHQPAPVPVTDPTDEQLLATVDAVTVTLPPLPIDHTDAHGRIDYDIAWRVAMARAVLARWGGQAAPVPVAERLPEPNTKVLAHYFNDLGKGRTICAIWVPTKTRSDSYGDDDFTEYDEESDTFYWPEGWYEAIENWDDLGYVKVDEGEVIYWQPLPKLPATALPLPQGEVQP